MIVPGRGGRALPPRYGSRGWQARGRHQEGRFERCSDRSVARLCAQRILLFAPPEPRENVGRPRAWIDLIGRWLARIGLVSLLATLSGCSVPQGGFTGVSVDASGQPVAVIAVCKGWIDGVVLYRDDGEKLITLGNWDSDQRIRRYAAVSLIAPPTGWTADHPLDVLQPNTVYSIFGGTDSSKWSTLSVDFTVEELRDISPGEVLYLQFRKGAERIARTPATTFQRTVCADFRD
ncbi:hypothetical protein [Cryptosporangium phraense]|uniref:Uncharacterized protein n=1 Tax=Cryptosporangium phraense TaxID=2593070 RepID=A0A545AZV5_9ACTN|nr:hypothetical protein [Cryptosporangium phraense]TQS46861.1 hypothetical protein FL583_00860 [Cryptosporangium phraense]